ncbi:hypothetical protein EZS27_032554, partial [termite gut metagenome]
KRHWVTMPGRPLISSGQSIHPKNADEKRTHLNRELIPFPEGVKNRIEAIQCQIENAGITRKIRKNQVRAIGVMVHVKPKHDTELHIKNKALRCKPPMFINMYYLCSGNHIIGSK